MILDKKMQVFLAVAEAGSFSRAARQLSLSQSVVSFHVDTLERELGVSLFHRHGRSISLTAEGELLFKEGKRLAQEARQLEDTFSEQSEIIAQRIRLAGSTLTCAFTVPWNLAAFKEEYPEVLFVYQSLPQDTLVEKLLGGELDMGFVGSPVQHRKLGSQVCVQDEIILVGAPDRTPDKITLEDLSRLPILWATGDRGLELLLSQSLSEVGLPLWKLNVFMEVEDLPILKTFVRVGVGLAFLPRLTVADELSFEILKEVLVEGLSLERMTYLVYPKKKHPREVINRFLDFMRKRSTQNIEQAQEKGTAMYP